jgi:hypothetical protein
VAAGLDLLYAAAVPKTLTICKVFGREPAIAEYVIMAMLRLFEAVTGFRPGSWVGRPRFGGTPVGWRHCADSGCSHDDDRSAQVDSTRS